MANVYIALGRKARRLGLKAELLDITCSDLKKLSSSPEQSVENTMALIADRTAAQLSKWLSEKPRKVLLSYGGALHNDLAPDVEKKAWSFAPSLQKALGQAYLEVDLVRAEALKPDAPWFRLSGAEILKESVNLFLKRGGEGALLLRKSAQSYYLVFGNPPKVRKAEPRISD